MRTRSVLCACVALALGLHLLHAARLHAAPARAAVADGSSIWPAQPAAGDAAALATSPAAPSNVRAEPDAAHDALEGLDAAVVGAHVCYCCTTLRRVVGRAVLCVNSCLRAHACPSHPPCSCAPPARGRVRGAKLCKRGRAAAGAQLGGAPRPDAVHPGSARRADARRRAPPQPLRLRKLPGASSHLACARAVLR
jgi:hypothetical protein